MLAWIDSCRKKYIVIEIAWTCCHNILTLTNSMSSIVSTLWFVMFREFRRPKTFRLPPNTPCRNWTPNPIRTHCESIRWAPRQNCVSPPNSTDCCRSHPRICRSINRHNGDRWFWSCGTVQKNETKQLSFNSVYVIVSTLSAFEWLSRTYLDEIRVFRIAHSDHGVTILNQHLQNNQGVNAFSQCKYCMQLRGNHIIFSWQNAL